MDFGMDTAVFSKWSRWIASPGAADNPQSGALMASGAGQLVESDDDSLFARVIDGDEQAFAAFYDRHANLLYAIAFRITGSQSEAEDALQEAAIQLWERAPSYNRSLGKPLSWAIALVRNKTIDRLRSNQRRAKVLNPASENLDPAEAAEPAPEARAFDAEDAIFVRRALATLGEDQRQAIELAFFGGLTQSEIAERLGQPLGTIKARIRRGMLQMRDALEGAL